MSNILVYLFLLSIPICITFLIRPRLLKPILKKDIRRKKVFILSAVYLFLLLMLIGFLSPSIKETEINNSKAQAVSPTTKHLTTSTKPLTADVSMKKTLSITSSPTKDMPYHPPANNIDGYTGINKVLINASLKTNANGVTFTNNEKQKWDSCIASINPDSGHSNWYEYDFGGIEAGQTQSIQWSMLTREDGTQYTNSSNEPKIIQLSCELGNNTIGFARFHY